MMKHKIQDAVQIVLAILLTTSLVVVNAAPLQQKPVAKAVAVVKTAPAPTKPVPAAVVTPAVAETPAPAQTPVTTPVRVPQPVYSGSHEDWMAAAGIAPSDYPAVDYIISHESGWNPDATEPNSGAHGLPQALPYSKTGCGWDDPVCQLQWASSYAVGRYGSWWAAQAFWQNNHYW